MHKSVINLIDIKKEINSKKLNQAVEVKVIAISKTFGIDDIRPLIDFGHLDFGENKVQEATNKWSLIKKEKENLNLHMVGKLQSNKVKQALQLFDYIHSLDSEKLVTALIKSEKKLNLKRKYFIQINIGGEIQKSGINSNNLLNLLKFIDGQLDVVGLMCIPPFDQDPENHFKNLKSLADVNNLSKLSMGMTADYVKACKYNADYIRVGSKIFGART